jgi:hypothetical protein
MAGLPKGNRKPGCLGKKVVRFFILTNAIKKSHIFQQDSMLTANPIDFCGYAL